MAAATSITAKAQAALADLELKKQHKNRFNLLEDVQSGAFVEKAIVELKKYAKNEAGDKYEWYAYTEGLVRTILDARIDEVYTSGASQTGKSITLNEWLPTSTGYRQAKDVKVGDFLIGVDGKPTKVLGVFPQPIKPFYKFRFKDGSKVSVCEDHLWEWSTISTTKVTTTKELYEIATRKGGFRHIKPDGEKASYHYFIPSLTAPAEIDSGFDCEGLNPYTLGVILGDGTYGGRSVRITGTEDDLKFYQSKSINGDIRESVNTTGFGIRKGTNTRFDLHVPGIQQELKRLGIHGQTKLNKRIPSKCLSMHWTKRLELLRGLMDADGCVCKSGASFSTSIPNFAITVAELVRSLGGKAQIKKQVRTHYIYKNDPNRECVNWVVSIWLPETLNPFNLPRKRDKYVIKDVGKNKKAIISITPTKPSKGVCFKVEHPRALFLLHSGIVTHNTVACTMVNSWLSQRANLRTLWVFPSKTQMEKLVSQQHTPTLNIWNSVNNIRPSAANSKRNTTTHDVGTGVANFSFDKGATGNKSGADAGTSAVAITADWLFFEEASQFQPGSDKVFHRRLDNGRLVKIGLSPKRYLGTCGGGNGIEALIRRARFEFYPHTDCLECGAAIALRADGCLLKPKLIKIPGSGTLKEFFDEDMKHHGHFHHDPKDPINTAFFGCPECGAEIPDESRYNAKFRDLKTGCPIEEWLTFWVPDHADEHITVGFWITPLVRQEPSYQLAPAMIRDLMEAIRLNDTLQQRFSMPSDVLGGGISRELVEAALNKPYFKPKTHERTIRLVGVDQGRANAYCAVIEFVYNESLPYRVATLEARRNILFLEPIKNSQLGQICEDFGIEGGLIDHAPSIAEAARLADDLGICMGVQKDQLMDEYRLAVVQDGGEDYDAYFLRYHLTAFRFMRSFHGNRVAINNEYMYQLELQTNQSIVTHLTDVAWDTNTSKLVKSARELDDLFFAGLFAESAFTLALLDPANFLTRGSLDYINQW